MLVMIIDIVFRVRGYCGIYRVAVELLDGDFVLNEIQMRELRAQATGSRQQQDQIREQPALYFLSYRCPLPVA